MRPDNDRMGDLPEEAESTAATADDAQSLTAVGTGVVGGSSQSAARTAAEATARAVSVASSLGGLDMMVFGVPGGLSTPPISRSTASFGCCWARAARTAEDATAAPMSLCILLVGEVLLGPRREKGEPAATHQALPASLSLGGRAAPGSAHKPKRLSVREQRAAARPSAWEAVLSRLEAEFGEDLCGLSGLVLADAGARP